MRLVGVKILLIEFLSVFPFCGFLFGFEEHHGDPAEDADFVVAACFDAEEIEVGVHCHDLCLYAVTYS